MSERLAPVGAVLRVADVQGAAPQAHTAAHWVSYGGGEAILLAIALLVAASGFAYAGRRLRTPLKITRPGGTVAGFMIAVWLLAIYTANVAAHVYAHDGSQRPKAPGGLSPRLVVYRAIAIGDGPCPRGPACALDRGVGERSDDASVGACGAAPPVRRSRLPLPLASLRTCLRTPRHMIWPSLIRQSRAHACGKTARVWLQGKGGGLKPGQAFVLLPRKGCRISCAAAQGAHRG